MNIDNTQPREHLLRAINHCGSQVALADKLTEILNRKIWQAHVRKWLTSTAYIPDYACKPIEQITGGKVQKHELRPDLWDEPSKKEVA